MRSLALLLLLAQLPLLALAESDSDSTTTTTTTAALPACTAISSSGSGAFFDLRPEIAVAPADPASSSSSSNSINHQQLAAPPSSQPLGGSQPTVDYRARGWDYGMNFTLNICGAVVEPVRDVVGVDEKLWRNVSAYYTTADGQTISIGWVDFFGIFFPLLSRSRLTMSRQQSMELVSRGRKLVLSYMDGSPCDSDEPSNNSSNPQRRHADSSSTDMSNSHKLATQSYSDLNDEPETEAADHEPIDWDSASSPAAKSSASYAATLKAAAAASTSARRKSTLISFHCDRDPSLKQAAVSFVGTTPDRCGFFFEVRSQHACARAEPDKPGSVGPGGVFALILSIAVMVYLLGGVFYNRTVAHARGWRQLPNYSLWAGMWNAFIVSFPSVLRALLRALLTLSRWRMWRGRRSVMRNMC